MRPLSRNEQETAINMLAAEKEADIYTSDPVMIRRMDKLCASRPDTFRLVREDEIGKTYRCPKKCVRVSAPRVMSEEQRAANAERLRKAREALA